MDYRGYPLVFQDEEWRSGMISSLALTMVSTVSQFISRTMWMHLTSHDRETVLTAVRCSQNQPMFRRASSVCRSESIIRWLFIAHSTAVFDESRPGIWHRWDAIERRGVEWTSSLWQSCHLLVSLHLASRSLFSLFKLMLPLRNFSQHSNWTAKCPKIASRVLPRVWWGASQLTGSQSWRCFCPTQLIFVFVCWINSPI